MIIFKKENDFFMYDKYKKAMEIGFKPENISKKFRHKNGTVVILKGINYLFVSGEVIAELESIDKRFLRDITHEMDEYELKKEK